ncbi:MAG: hypothetical protein ACK5RO_01955 [Pseudobdellovibrionaceae bacterium]
MDLRQLAIKMIEKWIMWLSTVSVVMVVWFTIAVLHDTYRGYIAQQDFLKASGLNALEGASLLMNAQEMQDWIEKNYCDKLQTNISSYSPSEFNTRYLSTQVTRHQGLCWVNLEMRGGWLDILATDLDLLWFPFWLAVGSALIIGCLFLIIKRLSRVAIGGS